MYIIYKKRAKNKHLGLQRNTECIQKLLQDYNNWDSTKSSTSDLTFILI